MKVKRKTIVLVTIAFLALLLAGAAPTLGTAVDHAHTGGITAVTDESEILQYTFDDGLEGWNTGYGDGDYDSAEWHSDIGNPPGSVELDGSDLGNSDGEPNAWMYRTITLPDHFNLLYFETRAAEDGALRVRLVDGNGTSHVLLDWEVLAGDDWRERTVNIGAFAGQTVTLYFEQGDNDVGIGEHRYVDNVFLCAGIILEATGASSAPGCQEQAELVADGLEVTQAIQDLNNSVRLVAHKRTFVRFHVRSDNGSHLTTARLRVEQGPNLAVLDPINPGGQIIVREEPNRGVRDHSFLFELPTIYSQGEVALTAEVNPDEDLPETDYENNTAGPLNVTFEEVPPLNLVFTRIGYELGGADYWPAIHPHRTNMLAWLRKAYPLHELQVKLRIHHMGGAAVNGVGVLTDPDCVKVNNWLNARRLADVAANWAEPNAHYYGMVSAAGGFMRGCASTIPGQVASGPAGAPTPGWHWWDTDGSYGDWYGGHELGHAYGREHAMFCGAAAGVAYPYPHGRISPALTGDTALFGFDSDALSIYGSAWRDMMTYCTNIWISDFTYEGLMDYFQNNLALHPIGRRPSNQGDQLLLSGYVDPESGELELTHTVVLPEANAVPSVPGDYEIVLRDAGGNELARHPFTPLIYESGPAPGATGETSTVAVNELVPFAGGTEQVDVEGPSGLLAQVTAGANPPDVTLLSPNGGEVIDDESVTVSWEASDPDGDPLASFVQYSPDNGVTWEMLALSVSGTSVQIDTENLDGSDQALFRVLTSDGLHTAYDVSDATFTVPNGAPEVTIISPDGGGVTAVSAGQTLALVGDAYDADGGSLESAQLTWLSNLDGVLGDGDRLSVTDLSVGTHTITLQAGDGAGAVITDAVEVDVVADITGLPPAPDSLVAGPSLIAIEPGAGVFSATVSVGNQNPANAIAWNAAADQPWVQLNAMSGMTPFDDLVVTVADGGDQSDEMRAATITFTSPDLPEESVTVRVEVIGASPEPLFLPAIRR